METTTKRYIDQSGYLKLTGLLVLAERHNRALKEIEAAAAEIVDEPCESGYYGVVSDEVVSERPDADDLLRRLGITVED